jgi:hypothetical protein
MSKFSRRTFEIVGGPAQNRFHLPREERPRFGVTAWTGAPQPRFGASTGLGGNSPRLSRTARGGERCALRAFPLVARFTRCVRCRDAAISAGA